MMESNSLDNKIVLLKIIQDNKDVLFGKFSSTLSHEDKANKWKDITEQCISMGIINKDRDWKYVRDTTWQNWRKRTMVISVLNIILRLIILIYNTLYKAYFILAPGIRWYAFIY